LPRRTGPDLTAGTVVRGIRPPKLTRRGRRPLLPHVLTPAEAGAILRVSRTTILKYLDYGRLQGFRMGFIKGGGWRTTDLDVLAFMGFESIGHAQAPGRPRTPRQGKHHFEKNHVMAVATREGRDPFGAQRDAQKAMATKHRRETTLELQ